MHIVPSYFGSAITFPHLSFLVGGGWIRLYPRVWASADGSFLTDRRQRRHERFLEFPISFHTRSSYTPVPMPSEIALGIGKRKTRLLRFITYKPKVCTHLV
jgi:hypothetical protein